MVSITAARKCSASCALGDVDHDDADSDHLFVDPDRVVARKPVCDRCARGLSRSTSRLTTGSPVSSTLRYTGSICGQTSGTTSATVRPICSSAELPLTSASVSLMRTMRNSRSTNAKPTGAVD